MRKNDVLPKASVSAAFAIFALVLSAQEAAPPPIPTAPSSVGLEQGFIAPPQSARPRVWWHWMNGNISQQGIKLDLEWMHRVGIAGFQNFDAALNTPQVVDHRLAYMTPEWREAFKYATTLADQLGMEEAIAGSPGWSESGGPWVPPAEGMKKYVWSETSVEGGKPFTGKLAHPPTVTGPFQGLRGGDDSSKEFYADTVVVAYRRPVGDVDLSSLHAKMTASSGTPDFALLSAGDWKSTAKLPVPAVGESAWIQWEFEAPQTIRAITYITRDPDWTAAFTGVGKPERTLEASDDGVSFREVAKLTSGNAAEHTIAFPAATARFFRVAFKRLPPPEVPEWARGIDPASMGFDKRPPVTDYEIAKLALVPGARVRIFEDKAAFVPDPDLYSFATPAVDPAAAISKSDVVDLTAKMHPDGSLDWTPPAGDWMVLRFGYSLLGITNHPATKEATGLEVDKLDGKAVAKYMNTYLDSYKETVGAGLMGKRGIRYIINDSWEAGSQNWTPNMIAQFRRLRGYDPLPWMPVLTGRVVESAEASDRFLWDFRKTIADLIATEHYGVLETVIRQHNMGHYGESHESGRAFVADGMEVKKYNEVPMSAMWTQRPGVNGERFNYNADDRESASVAHIYGQNLAAAESMTAAEAPWGWSPATLKPTADQEFLNGINRIVVHESAHQPLVGKAPGLTLGPFGQWFNRNETWAEQAGPWIDYLARTSFLLQQGHFAADLVYFYGEDSNLTAIFADKSPDVPPGFGFDYINADALIHELRVEDGRIATPGGMRYRVLGLDEYSRHMSLPVLRAIYKLVAAGAIVAGPKPMDDPSLTDNEEEFHKLSNDLFGDGTGVYSVGRGTVYAGKPLKDVFAAINLRPDFEYTRPEPDTRLEFVHRKLADADVYFVDNRSDRTEQVDATFRVAGKAPDLWRAETASITPATYRSEDGRTTVPLKLEPWGTVFVVFRKPTAAVSYTAPAATETLLATVAGPWTVNFQAGRGAPATFQLDHLASWTVNADTGVKYFSGTGTYTRTIDAPAAWFAHGAQIWIDLGSVKELASVEVNGKPVGTVWHTPFRVEATPALHPGANQLVVKVTNLWPNRMIGDQQPGVTNPITFADVKPYKATSPLIDSGLLGPVQIERFEMTPGGK
ncbi:MAG: glycosyl hydrolase [Terracidiphilus sp.]